MKGNHRTDQKMNLKLPRTAQAFSVWTWPQLEPHMRELANRPLTPDNLEGWLADWSHVPPP